MNEFEMIAFIVMVTMVSVVLMVRYKHKYGENSSHAIGNEAHNAKLESEVERLRERVQTLERIAVEKEDSLTRQIEQLRDR